jgi:hypothetical protein
MPYFAFISDMETLLLGIEKYVFLIDMFEKMASDAVQMLILLLWISLAFIIVWGILWARATKRNT